MAPWRQSDQAWSLSTGPFPSPGPGVPHTPLLCCPSPHPPDQAHANLANALQQLGAVDLALMYYSSALRLKPTFTDALNNMATAHLQKGAVAQVRPGPSLTPRA